MRPDLDERRVGISSGTVRELQYFGFGVFEFVNGEATASVVGSGEKMWLRNFILDFQGAKDFDTSPDVFLTVGERGRVLLCPAEDHRMGSQFHFDCGDRDLVLGPEPVGLKLVGGPTTGVGTAALIADVLDAGQRLRQELARRLLPPTRLDPKRLYAALDVKRTSTGLSWREVAAAAGIASPSTLTRIQSGETPSVDALVMLLAWLDWPDLRRFTITL